MDVIFVEKKKKFIIPDNFLYEESRAIFKEPDVIRDKPELEAMLKWTKPDPEALKSFLIEEKGFQENKVASGLTKLQNCQGKTNQSRLDLFFKSAGSTQSSSMTQKRVGGRGGASAAASGGRKAHSMGGAPGRGRGRR